MTEEEKLFHAVASTIPDAEKGQLFGKPCYKVGKKAFCCFFNNAMVFRLSGEPHSEALSYDGAVLFDPSRKQRPMKEWVQIPYYYKDQWARLAKEAAVYVHSLC